MLPGISGVDIWGEMRRSGNYSPILMLTANSMENERITGLDAGADDYVTKPFRVPEFLARVRAIFRHNDTLHEGFDHGTLVYLERECAEPLPSG